MPELGAGILAAQTYGMVYAESGGVGLAHREGVEGYDWLAKIISR